MVAVVVVAAVVVMVEVVVAKVKDDAAVAAVVKVAVAAIVVVDDVVFAVNDAEVVVPSNFPCFFYFYSLLLESFKVYLKVESLQVPFKRLAFC